MKISIITETTEDLEFNEPNGDFVYQNRKYPYWGNPSGRSRTIEYETGKFNRYAKMGLIADELLGEFRSTVESDPKSLDGRCSFACIVMMNYGIRIGNEDSAMGHESGLEHTENQFVQTYGTTTLLNKHVKMSDGNINLDFVGKTEVEQSVDINDPFIIKHAQIYYQQDRPDDKWIGIDYDTLFDFVKNEVGDSFVPKDFRTFCANTTAWRAIEQFLGRDKVETKTEANEEIKKITEIVAEQLGNTPGISKRNYIDSRMLDWFKAQRVVESD